MCIACATTTETAKVPLQWRHNGRDSVSNHQPHDCLLNRLFRRRSTKTSKLHVTGLCAQMASKAEKVSLWWRHHVDIRCSCEIIIHLACRTFVERLLTECLRKRPWGIESSLNNMLSVQGKWVYMLPIKICVRRKRPFTVVKQHVDKKHVSYFSGKLKVHGDYDTAILWQWRAICHVIHQCPSVGLPALDYRLFSIIAHNKIRRNVQDQKAGQSLFGCMTSWPVGITPDHAARLALITSLIAWLLDRWFVWYSRGDISMMYDIMWSQCLYLLWNNWFVKFFNFDSSMYFCGHLTLSL